MKRAIDSDVSVVLVTRGKRFGARLLDPGGRKHVVLDLEHLQDPARDATQTIHLGCTTGISRTLVKVPEFINVLNSIRAALASIHISCGVRGILPP